MTQHTILLIQRQQNKATRTFMDFETVAAALEEVVAMFERKLKETHIHKSQISYDIKDLYNYIDSLPDLVALVFAPQVSAYQPHDKAWIKDKVYQHLKRGR